MSLPQFLIKKLSLFFMLSTLITVAVSLIGSHFDSEAGLSYHALLSPLFYAACCVLPSFVTYSGRELKPREWVLRAAVCADRGGDPFLGLPQLRHRHVPPCRGACHRRERAGDLPALVLPLLAHERGPGEAGQRRAAGLPAPPSERRILRARRWTERTVSPGASG